MILIIEIWALSIGQGLWKFIRRLIESIPLHNELSKLMTIAQDLIIIGLVQAIKLEATKIPIIEDPNKGVRWRGIGNCQDKNHKSTIVSH